MTDHLTEARVHLAAGDVRAARAAVERARFAFHCGGGPNPFLLEIAVFAAENGGAVPRPDTRMRDDWGRR